MDKKHFFESFIVSDDSGQKVHACEKIQEVFTAIQWNFSDPDLQEKFEIITKEILFHTWMFEQICNGVSSNGENACTVVWPLIVISVSGEILFVNKTYCQLSGLSASEIQKQAKTGTLYGQVYGESNVDKVNKSINKLRSGRGYKQMELIMRYSGKRIEWNSYGGVGESLEIRSGREIYTGNDQKQERERFYRGNSMNTFKLIENLYRISMHDFLSPENRQKLIWIQEFLSMFDFLWNHGDLFMEIIDFPLSKDGKISGSYNTVYAQFLKHSFEKQKELGDIFSVVHGENVEDIFKKRIQVNIHPVTVHTFHQHNKYPIGEVCWQYALYPKEVIPGYKSMFSLGFLVHKIQHKNIFTRIFQYIFRSHSPNH